MRLEGVVLKATMFILPCVLVFGAGLGVAYHDGVNASDVHGLATNEEGQGVSVKGIVLARQDSCNEGTLETGRNVSCFVLRDAANESTFVYVTSNDAAPAVDAKVVVHGTLWLFISAAEPGSSAWGAGCWEVSPYGSSCAGTMGNTTFSGASGTGSGGEAMGWIDASDVSQPWFFR
ncbi:MAG: hypothetical protein ACYDDF_11110 [Thermoplasmatota archaeon]